MRARRSRKRHIVTDTGDLLAGVERQVPAVQDQEQPGHVVKDGIEPGRKAFPGFCGQMPEFCALRRLSASWALSASSSPSSRAARVRASLTS